MAVLAALVLLLVPASALGWGEVATRAVPRHGPASCLRSAGTGLLSMLGPLGRRTTPFDLVAASSGGLHPAGRAPFGVVSDCANAAANDAGTVAVAGADHPRDSVRARVKVSFRDAGRRLVTRRLAVVKSDVAAPPAVAVGPAGDIAVAWIAFTHTGREDFPDRAALYVARRSPGRAFSAPRRVDGWRVGEDLIAHSVAVGVDAAGRTTAVWTRGRPGRRSPGRVAVKSAAAARGQAFASRQELVKAADSVLTISLAVTPGGEALLAFADFSTLWIYERRATRFVERRPRGTFRYGLSEPAVAEAPDGTAVIAWRVFGSEAGVGGVTAIRRRGHARFGPPQELSPAPRDGGFGFDVGYGFAGNRATAPSDESGRSVRAAITPGGRAIVTWIGRRTVRGERGVPTAYAAVAGRPTGRFARRRAFGSPCRPPNGAAPVRLRSGRLGAAWTDTLMTHNPLFESPARDGILHLAFPGARKPRAAAPPHFRVRAPRVARLYSDQAVPIFVRCSRACDVRASLSRRGHTPRALGSGTLAPGALQPILLHATNFFEQIAPREGPRLRLRVHVCRPDGVALRSAGRTIRVFRRPAPPLAVPLGVTARRHGRRIVVRWHTAIRARRAEYAVLALKRRHSREVETFVGDALRGRGRRRFRVVLHAPRGTRLRWVVVSAYQKDPPHHERDVYVRIR